MRLLLVAALLAGLADPAYCQNSREWVERQQWQAEQRWVTFQGAHERRVERNRQLQRQHEQRRHEHQADDHYARERYDERRGGAVNTEIEWFD